MRLSMKLSTFCPRVWEEFEKLMAPKNAFYEQFEVFSNEFFGDLWMLIFWAMRNEII